MFKSKIDLYAQEWIDTIFEGRNKDYGAYDLRRKDAGYTVRATIIGATIFSLLVSTPLIVKKIGERLPKKETLDQQITLVDISELPPPPVEEVFVPPAPPVQEVKSLQEVKKFTPPVVAPENEIVEDLATQEQLKTAVAGSRNVDASEDGDVVIDEKAVSHDVEKTITEDNSIHGMHAVHVMPEFKGGMEKFMQYIMDNLNNRFTGEVSEIRMRFKFIVEKDGRLTDIAILDNGGMPDIASVVVKVLDKCPKWQPGIASGRPVRVAYEVPVVFKFGN